MITTRAQININNMDRSLRQEIVDMIDYRYRFNQGTDRNLEAAIIDSMPEVEEAIRSYYAFLPEPEIHLSVDELENVYELTMA